MGGKGIVRCSYESWGQRIKIEKNIGVFKKCKNL